MKIDKVAKGNHFKLVKQYRDQDTPQNIALSIIVPSAPATIIRAINKARRRRALLCAAFFRIKKAAYKNFIDQSNASTE